MLTCISGRRGVIGFNIAMGRVRCAKKFALLGLMVDASAKKFAQRTINAPKMAFYGLLGELFRENTGGGVVLGELFRGSAREVGCWANFFAPMGPQLPHNTCRPPYLKPTTSMLADHYREMKPLTPLLAEKERFQAIFHPQRRRRFHQMPNQGFWFSARHSDAHACCFRHNPGSVGA